MLFSSLALVIGAAESEETKEYTYYTNSTTSQMLFVKDDGYQYKTGQYKLHNGETGTIKTAEDKLKTMDYRYGNDRFEFYIDAYSGEVALRDKKSGEILFSNPYNIGASKASAKVGSIKDELLSQIVVHYTDVATNTSGTYYSYTWAATRGQIIVKNIKGGIRVEYTIGRVESRSLLPRMIEKSAMEEIFTTIKANIEEAIASGKVAAKDADDERHLYTQFHSYYGDSAMSLDNAVSDTMRDEMLKQYPILEKYDIYVLDDSNIGENTIKKLENLIKTYCPDYTFEDLDEDHQLVEYEGSIESSPLFKMALEYSLDENGLVVRLPANGIRFNETLYRLDSIEILPYMGAGANPNPGYNFFPDGSGTLFDFEDIAILGTRQLVSGKVYGQDYAYHEISGMYEEILRYPVFGAVETETLSRDVVDADGNVTGTETYEKDRGFVAIVEEGDSLMEISSYHAGQTSEYNTVKMSVYPRPTDTYNVADAISVGSNSEWTVVSARKYTGSYKIRYMMLTDEDVAEEKGLNKFYEASYVGMAKAYRDYLEGNGTLTRLTADKVGNSIPLYIETFGALETTERFLSIPVNVMTPLTSFADVATMYNDLKENEITNVNFILTGYTKGGMTSPKVPYNIKWEKAVSKDMDFEELMALAGEEGFGVFPDFDFVFASGDYMFDGLSLKKHAVKTIDNRYTSKREYSATKHTYVSYFQLALSPAYFSHFYEKFIPKYQKFAPTGISVSTLGSYLNSDFDEDEPFNRADSQQFTVQAFEYIREQFKDAEVMTSGGNAYCWKYVDHITDVALDSSRFSVSSASVPFLGIVLHGYVEIAGTPINMEGNIEYAFLKAMENGAAMKFVLSYRNTENLKEYETLSNYYSVRYDIWLDDVIEMYKELNGLLAGVQTSVIVKHEFLDGIRVPDADELAADAEQALKDKIAAEEAERLAAAEAEREAILNASDLLLNGTVALKDAAAGMDATLNGLNEEYQKIALAINETMSKLEEFRAAQKLHVDNKNKPSTDATKVSEEETRADRNTKRDAALAAVKELAAMLPAYYAMLDEAKDTAAKYATTYDDIQAAIALLNEKGAYEDEYRAALIARGQDPAVLAAAQKLNDATNGLNAKVDGKIEEINTATDAFHTYVEDLRVVMNTPEYENNKALTEFIYTPYAYVVEDDSTGSTIGGAPAKDPSFNKYFSDDNMIVYEEYENGTAFILNFNDYRVVVEKNGIYYTVEAYGYLVISRGA